MSNTEVYTDPDLFEMETLSTVKTVEPDSYDEHRENWYVFKIEISGNEEEILKDLQPLILRTEVPE